MKCACWAAAVMVWPRAQALPLPVLHPAGKNSIMPAPLKKRLAAPARKSPTKTFPSDAAVSAVQRRRVATQAANLLPELRSPEGRSSDSRCVPERRSAKRIAHPTAPTTQPATNTTAKVAITVNCAG